MFLTYLIVLLVILIVLCDMNVCVCECAVSAGFIQASRSFRARA